jgi:hypothetical protein
MDTQITPIYVENPNFPHLLHVPDLKTTYKVQVVTTAIKHVLRDDPDPAQLKAPKINDEEKRRDMLLAKRLYDKERRKYAKPRSRSRQERRQIILNIVRTMGSSRKPITPAQVNYQMGGNFGGTEVHLMNLFSEGRLRRVSTFSKKGRPTYAYWIPVNYSIPPADPPPPNASPL